MTNVKASKRFLTSLLIVILCLNTFLMLPAITTSQDTKEPGTQVSWEQEHETKTDTWSWQDLAWEFGPNPGYAIYLANGTEVMRDNFIPLGEDFMVVINVQKGIFTGNTTLGGAGLEWHMDIRNATNPEDYLGWADLRMGYINRMIGKFFPPQYKNGTYLIESSVFNRTEAALEKPEVEFAQVDGGAPNITIRVVLDATNMWNSTTPPQNLLATGSTTYTPGVRVGDWANYTLSVYLSDPAVPYEGPGNGTARIDILSVDGSNVTYGLEMTDDKGTQTETQWVDVSTGARSEEAMIIVASNLTQGDPIYVGAPTTVNQTVEKIVAGAPRLVNYAEEEIAFDRSTGILASMNMTMEAGGPTPEPGLEPGPGAGPSGPGMRTFYIWNKTMSSFNETAAGWTITIVGRFNATNTPMGPFHVRLEVFDSSGSHIGFGYLAWEGTKSPYRMIAVGRPGLAFGGYDETWTFEKLDMENHTVYSVARGQPWVMRVNVTSSSLANVTLAFDLDDNIKTYVNVTNWHSETVTEYGGWMYNETSRTYYWNSSLPVSRTEQVYGPHLEERWLWVPHQHEVNVTRWYWNEATGQNELTTYTETIWWERMFLIYDHLSGNFSVKQGYSYWTYDESLGRDREVKELWDLNASDPATQFYSLNLSRCRAYQTGTNRWTIDFVGAFNRTTYSTRDQYWVQQPTVYRTDGQQIWADWETVDWSAFEVAVDRMVAITKIIDHNGREVKMWMFQTDPGESFIIQSRLQGATELYDDIDAVGVRLHTGEGRWAPTESYWSDVEVKLIYNKYDGTLSSETYNRTEKSVYAYGPYKTWVEVNLTGFHNEYNATTGVWEWVNGTYTEWNYTTVTDWHWEYWSLNQTEYALNASSPNVWIDRSERWIPWDDPAFKVLNSYATLNSANISLVEGLVIANLNITFNDNAPQASYWWEMFFGEREFGPDYSRGWGEHRITEWTESTVYYVNSSGTNWEKWYVETPSQPYYSWYNGSQYRVYETPYIVIGANRTKGTRYYIKGRSIYEFGSGQDRTEYLFRGQWDPVTQEEPRFFELLNGTKIYVKRGYKVVIRDLKLNCTNAYSFNATGAKITLPNQTVFSTYMDHAGEDWGRSYMNETTWQHIVPYYYEFINGTRVYRDAGFETQTWNTTTNRWDLRGKAYTENATSLMVDYGGRCVFLNRTIMVPLREQGSWWQGLPSGTGYFLVMKNGTRIVHENPWMVDDLHRIVTIGGANYTIGWPNEYYTGTYHNRSLIIKGGWEGFVRDYYYATICGVKYEMPYPGALATSWWDLENLESAGGKIPTGKSIKVSGVERPIYQNGTSYYITVGGTRQSVTKPVKDMTTFYSLINGMEYWNLTQGGWSLTYGTYNQKIGRMDTAGTLTTTTGYDQNTRRWEEWNKYGEDRENSTRYLVMMNGSRIDVYSGRYLSIWNVSIGDKFYLTTNEWDRSEMVTTAKGETVWKQYITTLNGTKVYFDWGTNPASWIDEIHAELPGTNYTRLVPFEWENRTYFDKTYIYNITITDNEGMSWQNGTSVAVGTNVTVWGTEYGPGVRVGRDRQSGQEWWRNLPEEGGRAYLETIDGIRIYCNRSGLPGGRQHPFGWDFGGQMYLTEDLQAMQWNFINDNLTQGKIAVTAVEGGRYIRLIANGTYLETFNETTLAGWQYEYPDYYVILKNGTRLDFTYGGWTWAEGRYIGDRSIVIGDKLYWSDSYLGTYYNVTDSGVIHKLYNEDYLVPSTYQVPTPQFNDPTLPTIWMNATSDQVLINSSLPSNASGYYYLVNESSDATLDLSAVSQWWNLSEKVRSELFQGWDVPWEIRNAYPRYNATVNSVGYYVIDPSPTTGYWEPGSTWDHTRYSANFTFGGRSYLINYNDWDRFRWRSYDAIVVDGNKHELQDQWQWKAVYTVPTPIDAPIQIASENIYKEHTTWGPTYRWMLTDMSVFTLKTTHDIVVGTPRWGMWGVRAFTTDPDTGALDLDGDISTTADRYYVRRIHEGADFWNRTEDRMWVEIVWDPNLTRYGDEMHIGAWMGKVYTKWSFTWNETYIWYYASNMSVVSPETLSQINATIINSETGLPNAGYWEIARMVQNVTWEDLKAKAAAEGWDWFEDNTHEWEWMWFGTRQDYLTGWTEDGLTKSAGIGLQYEYAGLLLYNDTNTDTIMQKTETTHFFMPSKIGSLSFVTPGQDYGNTNATGDMNLDLNATVNFGVTFNKVNGTLFPYDPSKPRDMWGWWGEYVYGADFGVPNFMNKPTQSSVNRIQFMVHFNATETEANATNNEATMKIDERFGKWSIDPNVIDGRKKKLSGNVSTYLKGSEVFQNRSLAASWYITAFTTEAWDVKDEMGKAISPENVTKSAAFDVASAAAKFATFRMGGTYDWKKPIATNDTVRTFNVSSYTTPLGTFRASYVSDAGKSSAGFDITATTYFLTVGFPNWGGYGVYHDPQMSAYMAKFGAAIAPPAPAAEEKDHPITYDGASYYIKTLSNSTVSDFQFNATSREITLTVEGTDGTIGFTNVTIPKSLVNQTSDIKVYVDDSLVSHTLTENATHYFVYFTYQHSTHRIRISLAPPPTPPTPQQSSITCQLSKTSITKGDTVTISGAISPAVAAEVTIQTSTDSGSTWSNLTKVTSSADGSYSYTWTPTAAGTYTIRSVWSGNDQYLGATSLTKTLTVTEAPPPDYTIYIVAAVIALVIAAAGAFLMMKKRSTPDIKEATD